ncbi:class I SAM-dependent methyltransferase [Streptomyces chrestomyceticus]|uniref:class I SAM-dependent methyltransferase n=1 Tax=Streptomyces chrestomyceticus TaxID=68185 RepID=UPI00340E82E9
MAEQAWARGIPAVRQRAESLLFRDASVGGVLLAYGSHYIPVAQRGAVVQEAFQVLQPGGVFVLHDFLTDSPVDVWFRKVVDVYAAIGQTTSASHATRPPPACGRRASRGSYPAHGRLLRRHRHHEGGGAGRRRMPRGRGVPGRGRRRVDGDEAEGGTRGLRTRAGGAGLARGPRLLAFSSRRRRTAARGRGAGRRPASPGRG